MSGFKDARRSATEDPADELGIARFKVRRVQIAVRGSPLSAVTAQGERAYGKYSNHNEW